MDMQQVNTLRAYYFPRTATIVRDKKSSAVAGIYQDERKFYACFFQGRQAKPAAHHSYGSAESRNAAVARYFEAVQTHEAAKVERRAKVKAAGRGLEVGDVLMSMWGYEQTNVDYFEVTALIGSSMVEVREIGCESKETAFMQGDSIPVPGKYISEPVRRKAINGHVAIDSVRSAHKLEPTIIAGAKVYSASHWTAYA